MVTLAIEHDITDYAVWKQTFDRFATARRSAGVRAHRIRRPAGVADRIVVELDFATADQAQGFLDFLTTQIWSTPANAPALRGTPQTRLLEVMEQTDSTGTVSA
ncbi:hypothetical protein ACFXNW_17785 [Nocardia sp. NPDC059180]|uniref:hypothetical protein n=1 Tax=Nocardia sp. NPDC059180 TaxID=3346761 RepID=UPI0036AC37E6